MGENLFKQRGKMDHEWVELILEALEMGLSEAEIKTFFKQRGQGINLKRPNTNHLNPK